VKISRITSTAVNVALLKPMRTAIHSTHRVACVVVRIETDTGLMGESYVFTLNPNRLCVFKGMIDSLSDLLVGKSPLYIEQHWHNMWQDCNPIGQKGISISAISALDTALWDIVGKQAKLPLYQLFGACRDSVKAYASSGLWLSSNIDELVDEALGFVEQGFRSVKLRIGCKAPKDDVARVKALREALGEDIEILTDANQSLGVRQAISLAAQIAPFNIGWLEEPVAAHDLVGHNRVRDAIEMPLASGETEYTRYGMQDMLAAGAVDVLMPDLQRIGGLSEMQKSAAIAAAYNTPISTHIFTEQSLSIAGSCENCISVEHVDWFAPLFNEQVQVKDGEIAMPVGAGLGFSFNDSYIQDNLIAL